MRAVLLALGLCAAFGARAQTFISGFEEWTGPWPSGWGGTKTTMPLDSIAMETSDPHNGAQAMHVRNRSSSSRRISTLPLHVDSGEVYGVRYWLKGQGTVRPFMFDDNFWGGYNYGYNQTINAPEWTEFYQAIDCLHTTDIAEFIFGISGTNGPGDLLIDDVNIGYYELEQPPLHTIQEIQQPTDGTQNSPFVDSLVSFIGVVTGIVQSTQTRFFMQNGSGPWSGIYVEGITDTLELGEEVLVYGRVAELDPGFPDQESETMIDSVYAILPSSTGAQATPISLTVDQLHEEQWESVLVQVDDLECTTLHTGYWTGSDALGTTTVGELFYASIVIPFYVYSVTAVDCYHYENWSLQPRAAFDVVHVGIEENEVQPLRCYPNPANDVVNVVLDQTMSGPVEYEIQDASGRVVMNGTLNDCAIDVEQLHEGAYLLEMSSTMCRKRTRLVVQH